MIRTIIEAVPEPDYVLRLTYSDGSIVRADFKPLIKRGGVFAPLGDPQFFRQVSIGDRGRYIQWPGELDFCADALWLEEHAEDRPAVVTSP